MAAILYSDGAEMCKYVFDLKMLKAFFWKFRENAVKFWKSVVRISSIMCMCICIMYMCVSEKKHIGYINFL